MQTLQALPPTSPITARQDQDVTGASYACITQSGSSTCQQIAPDFCFTTLQVNGGTATLCINNDGIYGTFDGCPNGSGPIGDCNSAVDPITAAAIAQTGYSGILNNGGVGAVCTTDTTCLAGYFCTSVSPALFGSSKQCVKYSVC